MIATWCVRSPLILNHFLKGIDYVEGVDSDGYKTEAVKMAPIVSRLAQTPGIESRLLVTAQHREMLDQVLDVFGTDA